MNDNTPMREMTLRELVEALPRPVGAEQPTHRAYKEYAALVEALADDALPIMERQLESLTKAAPNIVGGKAHTAAVARLNRMRDALKLAEDV